MHIGENRAHTIPHFQLLVCFDDKNVQTRTVFLPAQTENQFSC